MKNGNNPRTEYYYIIYGDSSGKNKVKIWNLDTSNLNEI